MSPLLFRVCVVCVCRSAVLRSSPSAEKSRAQLRQRADSVAIVRALSRSDDARISAPAQECLKLLEQKEETQKPATPSVDYKGAVAPPVRASVPCVSCCVVCSIS